MLTDPYLLIINALGILIGIIFVFVNIGVGKVLTDPALKDYFRWVNFGVIIFILSFVADFTESIMGQSIAEAVHHLLMILFIVIFVIASVNLLQEMKQEQNK